MKNNRVGCLLAVALLIVSASSLSAEGVDAGKPIVIGDRFTFESKLLGEQRPYLVHVPNRYHFNSDRYPVLILLDGPENFAHTTATVDFLARNGRIPQMIVVGVANINRQRDMTPSTPSNLAPAGAEPMKTGGSDKFLAFIGDELLPEIDRKYRTHSYRVLVGHSLGGLVATYALVQRPEIFDAYIAISPSLWWDDQKLVKEAEAVFATRKDLTADFYMTMGNEGDAMLGGAWKLSAAFEEKAPKGKGIRWQFVRSPEETHGSIPLRSTYNGLQAIFDGWYIHDPMATYSQVGLAGLEAHYAMVSARLGYEVKVPDYVLGSVVRGHMMQKKFDVAETVLKRAVEMYPDGQTGYQMLTQLYKTTKNDALAIENATKLLKLYPGSMETRRMLAEYKVNVSSIIPDVTVPTKTLQTYVGEYVIADVELQITREGEKLFSTTDLGKFEIQPLSATKFCYVNVDIEVEFRKDKRGKVVAVTMERNGNSYDFTKRK